MYKQPFYQTLAIIIFSWTCYRIFFVQRIPYEINEKISWLMLLIAMGLLLSQLYFLKLNIKLIIRKKHTNSLLKEFLLKHFYKKPLENLQNYFLQYNSFQKHILILGYIFEISIRNVYLVYIITIVFLQMPRLIIAISLLLDIIFLNKIYTFYLALSLIVYIIIFQSLLSCIKEYITESRKSLNLKIIKRNNNNVTLSSSNNMTKITFVNYVKLWTIYTNILHLINTLYSCQQSRIYLTFSILINLIFVFSWSLYIWKVLISFHNLPKNDLLIWFIKVIFLIL